MTRTKRRDATSKHRRENPNQRTSSNTTTASSFDFPVMFGGDDGDSLGMLTSPLLSPPQLPAALPQQLPNQLQSTQPQWSQEETREFIRIRVDLENDFTVAKRNKTLWETVSLRMRESGYRRTPDQCKCKWKNLLNRYKVVISNP